RHYGIKYDGEGAHRADYDAEVLSLVLFHMLNAFGGEATLDDLQNNQKEDSFKKVKPSHITVFAKNKAGLKELFELITLSHTKYLAYNGKSTENVVAEPRIPRFELEKMHAKGNLLFGSACQNGEIFDLAHTRDHQKLKEAMRFYDYIEVQPLECYRNLIDRGSILNGDDLRKIIGYILEATQEEGKTVIATSDAHYVHPYEKRIRDIYINAKAIGNARHPLYKYKLQDRRMYPAPNQHLLTTQEMLDAFAWIGEEQARQIVIENPKKLAGQMEVIYPIKDKLYPPDIEGSDQKLRDICMETAHQWYGDDLPDIVVQRLQRELDSIIGAGYYVVYYISHLLVKKSREDGYLVGSRGSVGSSFVATMSGITEVNPLLPHYICHHCHHYEFLDGEEVKSGFDLPDKECPICHHTMRGNGQDIPFETFLGFEGDKVPDIDLNFSGEYQANAHAYTKEVFGEDHVFRAGTVGTVQEKTAYGFVRGYEEEMDLEIPFSEVKRTDLAKGCEGVKRTTGQHPGGIVVVPLDMDVHDFTPVQYPANNPYAEWKTTHFDFHQIHDNILKFDILGHVDPTAMKMLERMTGIDVTTIPMNDPKTMSIFSSLDGLDINSTRYSEVTGAAGIPEFGTPFVRGILEMTKPKTFAELVTISGLSHGTNVWLSNAKDLIENGTCQLNEVIGCRDDIMVDLMGYGLPPKQSFTIMESVRKGKGLKDEWEQLMKEHNVPDWYIDSCKKIKYMFPKAHAVAYVMMAVRIAWFKVHKPVYYYCQYFSIRCDAYDIETMIKGEEAIRKRMSEIKMNKDQNSPKEKAIYDTLELALEMVLRGFRFTNLSINRSAATEFRVNPDNEKEIIPPFTALDGLGDNVGRSIVKAREEQPFLSKEDVLKRTLISKTLLDKLSQMNATEGLDEKNQLTLF
ncbi:PolC-type DNA polymerase III, partial [Dubosiella newyorkensis]